MKRILVTAMAIMLLLCCLTACVMAEEAENPVYRTDVTEEDFIGTWNLKNMMMQGYEVPTESLGLHATVVITNGKIEITDVFETTSVYDTSFENCMLSYIDEDGIKMVVYITTEGLLHIDLEAEVFSGTAEDEGAPVAVGGNTLNLSNLDNSIITQYFEKVVETTEE